MLALLWLRGLTRHGAARLAGASVGVALSVALFGAIGMFIASSGATMTRRAIADVPVDWQLQLTPGAGAAATAQVVQKAAPVAALQAVGYAETAGFSASTGGSVQTTGPGKVLGLTADYRRIFPGEVRQLLGSAAGVLIAQQTAANLHVTVGDAVTIRRLGLSPVTVTVTGVVDLPNADPLFQAVGLPAGAAPQAPPDNVLLLPAGQWHTIFDPQVKARPDSVRTQLHIRLAHRLPASPSAAYDQVRGLARNVEARIAGNGIIGDNLAARLDGVRADALYSRVLFLFLGLPGVILAMLLTLAVSTSGSVRRRSQQALLRTRGASVGQVLRLESLEALVVAVLGALFGVGLAVAAGAGLSGLHLDFTEAALWLGLAAALGIVLALAAVLYPAWRDVNDSQVSAARAIVGRGHQPLWQRTYIDVILLALSGVFFWRSASAGYQVVLAPEGVSQTSVSYETFIAPVCLWLGIGLLTLRLWSGGLQRTRTLLAAMIRPLARRLSDVVAASLARQHRLITRGVALCALAFAFATATAIFNTTYNAQAAVDAQLTNGADVTVTGTSSAPAAQRVSELRALPGVARAEPMQHRFAYVGHDLQDMYGINPLTIGRATSMSDAYFGNHDARATLAELAARPDGLLVSDETVKDFQLRPGDEIRLRLQNAADHQYHQVAFHLVGIVREFPTAPKDSFLVANASYVAEQTGYPVAEIVLLRTTGSPAAVASRARMVMSGLPGARVTDLGATKQTIASSLTSVDLHGLTRLELSFAVLFLAGATGLFMALSMSERRRAYAILVALGAKPGQTGAFIWSEGLLVLISGAAVGIATGFAVAAMLVKVLTGVFDPPPESLAVPWGYLAVLLATAAVATVAAVTAAKAAAGRSVIQALRGA